MVQAVTVGVPSWNDLAAGTVVVNVRDFGAKGDGTTDDTASIQKAISAAINANGFGGTVQFPCGTYKLTSTLMVSNVGGLQLIGDGFCTSLIYYGNTPTLPVVEFSNAQQCQMSDMQMQLASGANAEEFIRLWRVSPVGSFSPSQDVFRLLDMNGTAGTLGYGVRIMVGSGGDINNDFHRFEYCRIQGYVTAGWSIEGSNAQGIWFQDCLVYGGLYGLTTRTNTPETGNFIWHGGFIGNATVAAFFLGDASAAGPVEIDGVQSEQCGRLVDCQSTDQGSGLFIREIMLNVRNVRFMTQALNPDGFAIRYVNDSGISIEQSTFGFMDATITKAVAFSISYETELYVKRMFSFRNNIVNGSLTTFNQIFPNDKPTVLENSVFRTGAGTGTSGFINNAILTVQGTGQLPFIMAAGSSVAGNQRAGYGYSVDGTEIWRTEFANDLGNEWRLLLQGATTALAVSPTAVLTLGGSQVGGFVLNSGITIASGAGIPNGVVTAPLGSLFLRSDSSVGGSLFVKETTAANTGWVPYAEGGNGTPVASAATITLGLEGYFVVTGTTTITSITAQQAGRKVTLEMTGPASITSGSNLILNGNFTPTVAQTHSTLSLVSDGVNWVETARSLQ